MRNFQRKPKAFRPNRLFNERAQLREQALAIESARLSKVETLKTDPLEFFRQVLGVEPTDYQKEFIDLFYKNQFIATRWSWQSGKSFTTSGILLNYALANPNFYIGVVGPSWRQTKLVIRRVGDFARHHVTWERAQEPNGPLKLGILEKIKKQPSRWRREMEAE